MHIEKENLRQVVVAIPARLYHGAPAILLGIILNMLDAVSTGLLVFPSTQGGSIFTNLQVQAMSLYLMSTITSQIALTFGGSLFPGALGSMLIEILPFLRGIATSIQKRLGDDNPNILPTVMVAYTLTSFFIGITFISLAVFRCGRIVEYFPRTVLRGAIGAIGLSLFLLGLELTLPPTSDTLSLSCARRTLFSRAHFPLLAASFIPALFLSISIRMSSLSRVTRGFTDHALYVPVYIVVIAGTFWAVAAGAGYATVEGMEHLSATGWLFTVENSVRHQKGIGRSWDYWSLFDFKRIEWHAMGAAVQNIVLLVIIGVLNLPIYIPAMAVSLNMPSFNMNHELMGHGLSNIFAGIVGTIPNLVVLSNTRFFTLAGGGRFEGVVVILLTVVLFFISSLLLPFVPTILASTLVLFLGIELMAEALWHTLETLLWSEYAVVLGTLLSCTFIGFAPGFGVGVGLAVVLHFAWGVVDTPVRSCYMNNGGTGISDIDVHSSIACSESLNPKNEEATSRINATNEKTCLDREKIHRITVVQLTGYVFFANIPSLERKLKLPPDSKTSDTVVIDLSKVHRLETSVVEFIERKVREYSCKSPPTTIVLAGVNMGSGISGDLLRGGIDCCWMDGITENTECGHGIMTFAEVKDATMWIKHSIHDTMVSDKDVMEELHRMVFGVDVNPCLEDFDYPTLVSPQFIQDAGVIIRRPNVGDFVLSEDNPLSSIFLVICGRLAVGNSNTPVSTEAAGPSRLSVKRIFSEMPQRIISSSKTVLGRRNFRHPQAVDEESQRPVALPARRQVNPGDYIGIFEYVTGESSSLSIRVTSGPCCLLEVPTSSTVGVEWAMKISVLLRERERK